MKKQMYAIALTVTVFSAGSTWAQEMGAVAPVKAPVALVESEKGTSQVAPTSIKVSQPAPAAPVDTGVQAAVQAQVELRQANGVGKDQRVKNALELLHKELGVKYYEGYHPDRNAYIQCGFANKPCNADTFDDDEFMTFRNALVSEAILSAKANIIMAFRSDVVAAQRQDAIKLPKFQKQFRKQIEEKEEQKKNVLESIKAFDEAVAGKLEKITDEVTWKHEVNRVVSQLALTYDLETSEPQKRKMFKALKDVVDEACRQIGDLEKEAREYLKIPIDNFSSQIEAAAHEVLIGATVLKQTESFDGQTYQIAVAVIWSEKLQERAVKTLSGVSYKSEVKGEQSLTSWLRKCEADNSLGSMVGARQYTDDQGRHYFLGIAANDVSGDLDNLQMNMRQTDLFAKQQALFSLFSDVSSTNAASMTLSSYKGAKHVPMSQYAETLTQEVSQKALSGLTKVYDATVTHVVTGRKLYVSVAAIDGLLAAKSSDILAKLYRDASANALHSSYWSGVRIGQREAYTSAVNNALPESKGIKDGFHSVAPSQPTNSTLIVITPPNITNPPPRVPDPVIAPDGQKINDDF